MTVILAAAGYVLVLLFVLALCVAAGRADEAMERAVAEREDAEGLFTDGGVGMPPYRRKRGGTWSY